MKDKRSKHCSVATALILVLSILLTGCSTEKSILENTAEGHIPTPLEAYNGNEGMVAEDEKYYYLATTFRLYAIDKETWEVQKACRDAMCSHKMDCTYSGMPESVVNVGGNIFLTYSPSSNYFSEHQLYRLNPLSMELEAVYEDEFDIGGLQNYEDQLLYAWLDNESAKSGVKLLNPETGASVQIADKSARIRYDDSYFYINTANECALYRLSKDLQNRELLSSDIVSAIQLDGEYLYYTYYDAENAVITLGRMTKDGKETESLVPGVWNWFHVYQGKVYYTDQKTNDLFVMDLKTRESTRLAEKITFMFYLLPGADKLIINQDGTYSCMNLDGSGLKELFYEPSEFTYR